LEEATPGKSSELALGESLNDWLDAIGEHPEWDSLRRDRHFEDLVASFPVETLLAVTRSRVSDLSGPDAEHLLRIIEAFGGPEDRQLLAEAVSDQDGLPLERAWEALSLLDSFGLIDQRPALAERWEDLNEIFERDDSVEELAEQLEHDPDGHWLALEGLESVEPEVRAEIITSLVESREPGPGLVEFFRLLAHAHDPLAREAALRALEGLPITDPSVALAWASIATDHQDVEVSARASLRTKPGHPSAPRRLGPRLLRSAISSVDQRGRGHVVLQSMGQSDWASAHFSCDLLRGITEVSGVVSREMAPPERFFDDFFIDSGLDVVEGVPVLAHDLLAGGLLLCGPDTTPALRFWLERTIGPALRPKPLSGILPEFAPLSSCELSARAETVLDACPNWLDRSDLTYELAEEILLREGDSAPEPNRDLGAFRFFFENRLRARLELDQRMLYWMAAFWRASGADELARSAADMVGRLADPAQAVPGHPFLVALATRSFVAAQANLRQGIDLRDPAVRKALSPSKPH
jgi:hypothetical protein